MLADREHAEFDRVRLERIAVGKRIGLPYSIRHIVYQQGHAVGTASGPVGGLKRQDICLLEGNVERQCLCSFFG